MSVRIAHQLVQRVLMCDGCGTRLWGSDNESSADLRDYASWIKAWSCAGSRDLCPSCVAAQSAAREAAAREQAVATQRRREARALEERIYKERTKEGRELSEIARSLGIGDEQGRQMYEAAEARHDAARTRVREHHRQARERDRQAREWRELCEWRARVDAEEAKEAALPP